MESLKLQDCNIVLRTSGEIEGMNWATKGEDFGQRWGIPPSFFEELERQKKYERRIEQITFYCFAIFIPIFILLVAYWYLREPSIDGKYM